MMACVGKLEDPSADGVVAETAIEIGFDAMRKSFPKYPVGTKVLKYFNGHGWFHGVISRQDQLRKAPSCLARVPWVPTYLIEYDDGDREWADDSTITLLVDNATRMAQGKCDTFGLAWKTNAESSWIEHHEEIEQVERERSLFQHRDNASSTDKHEHETRALSTDMPDA